jgi:small subunit ribosomal protein S4
MGTPRPKVRLGRAVGLALTAKSVKYFERRPYPPGVHGRKRKSESDYKLRLVEKQRLRLQYDVSEAQMRRAVARAQRSRGKTGEALVVGLELRLDAVVLRSGIARTIYQARQFVTHRHITVNGARVDRPSYQVNPGDVVEVHPRSRPMTPFRVAAAGGNETLDRPAAYLDVALADLRVGVARLPRREEIPVRCDEQLVVEYYAR